ncbi:hypothetical protein EV714DRAFT_279555 [Schizophyllum commune]
MSAMRNGTQGKGSTNIAFNSSPSSQNQQSGGDATKQPARRQRQSQGALNDPQTESTTRLSMEDQSTLAPLEDGKREPPPPIHRLPVELLAEIFLMLRTSIVSDRGPCHDLCPKLERTITRVCQTWRRVAYDTASLWTFLAPPKPEGLDSYLERYLPLTKGCLLDLHVGGSSDSDDPLVDTASNELLVCFEKLRPYATRWRALRLSARGKELRQLTFVDTPNLEEVTVWISGNGDIDSNLSLEFLEGARRIRRLRFHAWTPLYGSTLRLPSNLRLTTLSLELVSFDILSIIPALQQCSKTLEELDVTVCLPPEADLPAVDPVAFPVLKRLNFYSMSCDLMLRITAPNLEDLTFDFCDPENANSAMEEFFLREPSAATHLRRLEVQKQHPRSVNGLLQCLSLTTHLEKLSLGHIRAKAIAPLLSGLTCREDTPPLLPKLTSLEFTEYEENETLLYEIFRKSRATRRVVCGVEVSALRSV